MGVADWVNGEDGRTWVRLMTHYTASSSGETGANVQRNSIGAFLFRNRVRSGEYSVSQVMQAALTSSRGELGGTVWILAVGVGIGGQV